MDPKDSDKLALANRPDALGIFPDSLVSQVPSAAYSKSRYAAAVERLVARLLTLGGVASGSSARGKRRGKDRPQDKNNTIRTYLKSLELWSYYSIANWGRELAPREISIDTASEYALWLHGDKAGPDVRRYFVAALGNDFVGIYEALEKSCRQYGEANIVQIAEALPRDLRDRLVRVSTDPRQELNVFELHRMMGRLIRSCRQIVRMPNANEIRREEGSYWTVREQDPYTYRYAILGRSAFAVSSVCTHLSALSAVWGEMAKPTTPDEPALVFNPWKSPAVVWTKRLRFERANAQASGLQRGLTIPLVRSMLNAALGAQLENRRDFFALTMLTYLGVRAEELAGLLRSDVRVVDGVLNIAVLGKGNFVRLLPMAGVIKDAWTLLNGALEAEATKTMVNESALRVPTYNALYAKALQDPEAPLVPSLARWGCNNPDKEPEKALSDARQGLDTSGVRAMIDRIALRARVRVVATGEVRRLTECLPQCKTGVCNHEMKRVHPHAFRHYAATASTLGGMPLTDVRDMLGHFSIRTTETYIQIAPQKSAAFSAAVYRVTNRQTAMTAEELASMKPRSQSPLEEPEIVEAEPLAAAPGGGGPAAKRVTPLSEPEKEQVIASPFWAYEAGDAMLAYLPGVSATKFSIEAKNREMAAQQIVTAAEQSQDTAEYAKGLNAMADARARHLWTTFRIGKMSRLPWWAGRANRWEGPQMAPILSYAQIAPETADDAYVLEELRWLYDEFWNTRGPTAAAALVIWLGELLDVASVQFTRDMAERKDSWISFETPSTPNARVVREHHVEQIMAWLEDYGGAVAATGYKTAKNRGNIAIAAMDTLPPWFFVPDPLTDENVGLPAAERLELQRWILALQGQRPSRVRFDQWTEQILVRLVQWRQQFDQAKARGQAGAKDMADLEASAKRIENFFVDRFPKFSWEGKTIDVRAITADLPAANLQEQIQARLSAMLTAEGVPFSDVQAAFTPTLDRRAGMQHLLDPALLTFNAAGTIVHDDATKRYWFEKYGTDSECVVRRAIRVLWDRRRRSLKSQTQGLIVRHFDLQLSSLIPCPAEMEKRMRDAGWKAPQTIDELIKASKVMWSGLCDRARARQGARPITQIPPEAVETFWNREIEEIDEFVEQLSPEMVEIVSGSQAEEQALDRIEAEPDVPEPQQPQEPPSAPATAPMPSAAPEAPAPPPAMPPSPFPPVSAKQTGEYAESFEAERAAAREAKLSPEEKEQRRRKRLEEADAAAGQMARTAEKRGYTTLELDPNLFWTVVRSPAKYILLGTPTYAGAFDLTRLRRYEQVLRRFRPRIFWDMDERKLRFRYKYPERGDGQAKAGANLLPMTEAKFERKAAVIAVEFPGTSTMLKNPEGPPIWLDVRPWAPRWPQYPAPATDDAADPIVQQMGWPNDPDMHPLERAIRWEGAMQRYAYWKRAGSRATGSYVPNGWKPGIIRNAPSKRGVALPHPIDFAFAALRSA